MQVWENEDGEMLRSAASQPPPPPNMACGLFFLTMPPLLLTMGPFLPPPSCLPTALSWLKHRFICSAPSAQLDTHLSLCKQERLLLR